jgi:cell shape-determining protein MreD
MWIRRIAAILAAAGFGLWDAAIASWFPEPLTAVKFGLPFVVILSVFFRQERAVTAAIACGVVMDVFLPSNAGFVSVRYVLIALALYVIRQHILTNRSLIGVAALGALAVCMNRLLLMTAEALQTLLGRSVIPEASPPFWAESLWMLLAVVSVFLVLAAFGRRFLPLVSMKERGY